MMDIRKNITSKNFRDQKLRTWLDNKFHADLVLKSENEDEKKYSMLMYKNLLEWGQDFNRNLPQNSEDAFFYIRDETHHYPIGNLQGRASFNYIWPKFFEIFPLGEIWVIDLSYEKWFHPMWKSGKEFAKIKNFDFRKDGRFQPLEATGFSGESFPLIALSFMETCIFPFLTALYSHTASDLVFLFIPDRTFNYSILKENITFSKMFFSIGLDSVYSDDFAFDKYGSKFEPNIHKINPVRLKNFFNWFINNIGTTMDYLLRIENPEEREKVAMTLNRAIWDAHISICSEIPYVSKSHFFGVLDKISNILGREDKTSHSDSKEWLNLVDPDFIRNNLGNLYEKRRDPASEYLLGITNNTANYLEEENYTPSDLYEIRNSIHGYNIRKWDVISKRSGELTNNIALLSLPLVLYLISSVLTENNN